VNIIRANQIITQRLMRYNSSKNQLQHRLIMKRYQIQQETFIILLQTGLRQMTLRLSLMNGRKRMAMKKDLKQICRHLLLHLWAGSLHKIL